MPIPRPSAVLLALTPDSIRAARYAEAVHFKPLEADILGNGSQLHAAEENALATHSKSPKHYGNRSAVSRGILAAWHKLAAHTRPTDSSRQERQSPAA